MTLPQGWVEAPLGDVCTLLNGRAYKREELLDHGKYPVLRVGNFFTSDKWYFSDLELGENKYCNDGDLLYAWSVSFGPRLWVGGKVIFHYHIWRVEPENEVLNKDFLFHWFRWDKENIKADHGTGTTMIHVTKGDMEDRLLLLPPLAEQRRIVAKLDALTARLDRARAELDRVPVLAERLRVNVLREVFAKRETELPTGWSMRRIDEVGDVQLGRQRSPKDHNGPHMRPYLRSANITWKGWDLSDVKEMNFAPEEFETFRLLPGDVLLNEGSGSAKEVGKPAIWRGEIAEACFQNTLLRVRPKAYSSELLRYGFLYLALSGQFIANTKGVNIIHIGKAGLAKTTLPLPPADQQGGIVSDIDAAFARADRLEAEAARARALLDRLEAAILARAFRGELVPQDPADEPASVLLDRIRAARAAAPKAKRGRKPAAAG